VRKASGIWNFSENTLRLLALRFSSAFTSMGIRRLLHWSHHQKVHASLQSRYPQQSLVMPLEGIAQDEQIVQITE
jgi:hypothetical protein